MHIAQISDVYRKRKWEKDRGALRWKQKGKANECVLVQVCTKAPTLSIHIQPERVVSVTTIVGNMIFHYTLCKQCNLSVLSINMIDCGLSQEKSDTSGKKKFFPNKAHCIQAATESGD